MSESNFIQNYYDRVLGHQVSRSLEKCVDSEQNPIPWMTYSAIFQLEQYDFSNSNLFEWGSGYSSLYWANRCKHLTTVEHDESWAALVRNANLENVNSLLVGLDEYAEQITGANDKFDVIIIDGYIHQSMRRRCAELCEGSLSEGGMIILDNSDWLQNTCKYLRDIGFQQSDYVGPGPLNNYPWVTSIFSKSQLKFGRVKVQSPGFIDGGLQNIRD